MITQKKCFVIAEAGINHNGSLDTALKMIKIASEAGADAIKFQTFKAEKLVTKDAETAEYQKKNGGFNNQYDMLKQLELKEEDYPILIEKCIQNNIEFMSTPFDHESLDFLINLGMRYIKVPSGELTNLPFLKEVSSKNLPIILSTGMGTLDEIKEAVHIINETRKNLGYSGDLKEYLTILHCTSNYPCAPEFANLRAITVIKEAFKLPVGYSDHTLSLDVAQVCLGLGATVYEKHFTLDKKAYGPDHAASLSPEELKEMIQKIRFAELVLGEAEKKPTPSELDVRKIVRKSIALNKKKQAGEKIKLEDIHYLRPGTGIEPKFIDQIIEKVLKVDLEQNSLLQWEFFS